MEKSALSEDEKKLEELTISTTERLNNGCADFVIIDELKKKGWPENEATDFVKSIYNEVKKEKLEIAKGYFNHMIYGSIWVAAGTAVTLVTYFAAQDGGFYIAATGAIGWGVIDILRGLFGWLNNKNF